MRNKKNKSGFTLVELLTALVVFGILATAMTGVVRGAIDSVEQARSSVANTVRLRALESLLGDALRGAESVDLSSQERRMLTEQNSWSDDDGTFRFRGDAQFLGFCLPRPFLRPERDGWLHWITLEIMQDEETELFSLRLRDVAFLRDLDNPDGDDWSGMDGDVSARLPVQETVLIRNAPVLNFRYWVFDSESSGDPLEMETEEISGSYAFSEPEFIELEIQPPRGAVETLRFDYSMKGKLL